MSRKNEIKEFQCESWSDLLAALTSAKKLLDPADDEGLWFRGCRERYHKLAPSLMRHTHGLSEGDHYQVEQDLFFEFQARATELRLQGLTDWEYLFFSRHYGVPTRVLDWTDTFGVAVYFALEEWNDTQKDDDREPAIWIINPYSLNKQSWKEREIILPKYLGLDDNQDYWDFGELLTADGPWAWNKPVAIYPIQINERVRAQRGWFTIHGNDRRALEKQFPQCLVRLILKKRCIPSAREFLHLAGFSVSSIYPDLEHLATSIREESLQWASRRRVNRRHSKRPHPLGKSKRT